MMRRYFVNFFNPKNILNGFKIAKFSSIKIKTKYYFEFFLILVHNNFSILKTKYQKNFEILLEFASSVFCHQFHEIFFLLKRKIK